MSKSRLILDCVISGEKLPVYVANLLG